MSEYGTLFNKYRRRIHSITNQRGYMTVLSLRRSCIVLYFISNIKCQAFRIKYDSMLVRIVELQIMLLSRRVWILIIIRQGMLVTREGLVLCFLPKGGISYPHRSNCRMGAKVLAYMYILFKCRKLCKLKATP